MTIEEYKKLSNTSGKVYYFGGSFDPVTIAHEQIISYLKKNTLDNDIILIGPNSDDYHFLGKVLTPLKIRLEMLDCIIDDKCIILSSPDKFNGVINILEELNHPIYVIGSDSLHTIDKWVNYEKLIKDNKFLVFEREGYSLNILNENKLLKDNINNFKIAEIKLPNISSTNVRDGNIDEVSDKINKIIDKYQLYKR